MSRAGVSGQAAVVVAQLHPPSARIAVRPIKEGLLEVPSWAELYHEAKRRKSDLKYDLKHGFVTLDISTQQSSIITYPINLRTSRARKRSVST